MHHNGIQLHKFQRPKEHKAAQVMNTYVKQIGSELTKIGSELTREDKNEQKQNVYKMIIRGHIGVDTL